MAMTAVVLGGASIFGGRGTVLGTMLGLFGIVILQNGLRLSGQPTELTGILTGVFVVGTIFIDRVSRRLRSGPDTRIETIDRLEPITNEGTTNRQSEIANQHF